MFHRFALFLIFISTAMTPCLSQAQSFDETDVEQILNSYEMGAYEEIQQLKIELLANATGFKFLQNAPENAVTRTFLNFGQSVNSPSIEILEKIAIASGFESLGEWAITHDRILGITNAALHTGWGLHSKNIRYSDPDYPDTLAFMRDQSVPWAQRAQAIKEFGLWCSTVCVSIDTQENDQRVLAPRYLEVVKRLFPQES